MSKKVDRGLRLKHSSGQRSYTQFKAIKMKMKKKLKSRPYYKEKLDDVFSLYIRKRDNNMCVQQGLSNCSGNMTAGHLITRYWESVRWDENNVFAQCSGHNLKHEHDPHEFVQWYVRKFGTESYEKLYQKAMDHSTHLSRSDLIDLIEVYKNKLNEL